MGIALRKWPADLYHRDAAAYALGMASAPTNAPADFASLLAALSGAGKERAEAWDTSALGEDVATISYEQALRARRRVRTDEPAPPSTEMSSSAAVGTTDTKKAAKIVSVTIRVTEDEGQQLHARAKEAGLTVSAYLRSCVFEAESLRAQVKHALLQMREASALNLIKSRKSYGSLLRQAASASSALDTPSELRAED